MTTREATNLAGRRRLDSVDLLRGLVMVIMALDHVREWFTNVNSVPPISRQATPVLFLTRWVTHFCAPSFVFLAGTAAYLSMSRGKSRKELSVFLLTRGLWLVVLELTLLQWFFRFNFDLQRFHERLVFWALGWSMVALSGTGLPAVAGHHRLRTELDSLSQPVRHGAPRVPWVPGAGCGWCCISPESWNRGQGSISWWRIPWSPGSE
jgi:uncharacterized membrane protein